MKTGRLLILPASPLFTANALADESLLRKSGCFACHTVDKLAKKVRAGGSGNWGTTPMAPAPAAVSDADLKEAIARILTLK